MSGPEGEKERHVWKSQRKDKPDKRKYLDQEIFFFNLKSKIVVRNANNKKLQPLQQMKLISD